MPHDPMMDDDYDEDGNLDGVGYPIPAGLQATWDEMSKAEEPALGIDLMKATWPPKGGWSPIPGGKKGGYRKRGANGKWQHRYKPTGTVDAAPKPKKEKKAKRIKLERDPTRGPSAIQPGEIIELDGYDGRFLYTPKHAKSGRGRTWVQQRATGEYKLVRSGVMVAMREKKPERKVPPPPPPPVTKRTDKPQPPVPQPPVVPERPERPPRTPTLTERRPAGVWKQSTAKKGSVLEALENGSLKLRWFQGVTHLREGGVHVSGPQSRHGRWTIDVPGDARDPTSMKSRLYDELEGVFHQAVRRVAPGQHIPIVEGGELSQGYKDLLSGAHVGFMMALNNYRGDRAFIPLVQDYAQVYAVQAARQSRRGFTITDKMMRNVERYRAAKSRVSNASRNAKGEEPTAEDIAKVWYLPKRDIFTGRAPKLGAYQRKGADLVPDQGKEQVPNEDWQVMTPTGKPEGRMIPGKLSLIKTMELLIQGQEPADEDWMIQNQIDILPDHTAAAMTAGTALYIRSEVQEILARLPPREGMALAMRFGMHESVEEDLTALGAMSGKELKEMAQTRGLKTGGSKSKLVERIHDWGTVTDRPGTGGRGAGAMEVADALGIAIGRGDDTRAAAVRRIWKNGFNQFSRIADVGEYEVRNWAKQWDPADPPKAEPTKPAGSFGPSHGELRELFGSDERVHLYQAMVRAGKGQRAKDVLMRENTGETTPAERQIVRAQAAEQKRKEAQIAFNRHGLTHEVDPEDARDVGMGTGTPGESEWLYPPTVTTDWMKMIQWAVYSDKSVALGEAKRGGTAARAAEAAAKKEEKADG